MNKIISKVKEKDDIIIFFVIFCISIGVTLNMPILDVDEIWNFQSAYKLYNGYEIYKEFNVIVTPLFFWCTELIFRIFGANLAIFRISHCVLMATYFLLSYKLLKKLEISKPISLFVTLGFIILEIYEVIGFPLLKTGGNYNQMAMLLAILGMYFLTSERFHKNYILQAMISVLTFLAKQTIGVYYMIANILYLLVSDNSKEEKIKKGIQYIVFTALGLALFLFVLLLNNSVYVFFDYVLGGILEFVDKNTAFEVKSLAYLVGVIGINIVTNILVLRKKCFLRQQEESIKRLFIFSIIFAFMAYPIVNAFHVILAIYFSVINLIYIIYYLFKDFKDNINKILKIVNLICIIVLIVFSGYHLLEWKKAIESESYPYSWQDPFFGGTITQEEYEKKQTVTQYIESNDKNVIVLSEKAALYMVPLKRNNGDFDLPLKGNLGSQGEDGLIEKMKQMRNTQFLIYSGNEKVIYQETEKAKEYIKNTMECIGKIDEFDIYE